MSLLISLDEGVVWHVGLGDGSGLSEILSMMSTGRGS